MTSSPAWVIFEPDTEAFFGIDDAYAVRTDDLSDNTDNWPDEIENLDNATVVAIPDEMTSVDIDVLVNAIPVNSVPAVIAALTNNN